MGWVAVLMREETMAEGKNKELISLLTASNIYADIFDVTRIVDVNE